MGNSKSTIDPQKKYLTKCPTCKYETEEYYRNTAILISDGKFGQIMSNKVHQYPGFDGKKLFLCPQCVGVNSCLIDKDKVLLEIYNPKLRYIPDGVKITW